MRAGHCWTVAFLILSGCAAPRVDTSNDETTRTSLAEVRSSLSELGKAELEEALWLIAHPKLKDPAYSGQVLEPDAMAREVKAAIAGKNAEEIVRYSRMIRRKNLELEIRQLRMTKFAAQEAERSLREFVTHAVLYPGKTNATLAESFLVLSLKNTTPNPVNQATLEVDLRVPGSSSPQVQESFELTMKRGLWPGASATLQVTPDFFSENQSKATGREIMQLRVRVRATRLVGLANETILPKEFFSEEEAQRLEELEKEYASE